MSFMFFMLFLFRLLESLTTSGVPSSGSTQILRHSCSRRLCPPLEPLAMTGRIAVLALLLAACTTARDPASSARATSQRTTATRIFEIRTYTAPEGKLDALHARFRDHTVRIFERHGMTSIGYWTPTDSVLSKNTIIYILAYPSREAARESWAAFGRDPEWQKVRAESEANGRIVERVQSVFVTPTDYSPIR